MLPSRAIISTAQAPKVALLQTCSGIVNTGRDIASRGDITQDEAMKRRQKTLEFHGALPRQWWAAVGRDHVGADSILSHLAGDTFIDSVKKKPSNSPWATSPYIMASCIVKCGYVPSYT